MKYTIEQKKPDKDQIIVFKANHSTLPEIGIWSIFDCIKDVPENRSKDNRFERGQLVRNMVNPKIGEYVFNCA